MDVRILNFLVPKSDACKIFIHHGTECTDIFNREFCHHKGKVYNFLSLNNYRIFIVLETLD